MMISQLHHMLSRFSDFDAATTIAPPGGFIATQRSG
jgi:hypothetical protein